MDENGIRAYFRKITPLDKAGAYAAQAKNAPKIVESIRGSFTNVVGLPMEKLCDTMKRL
jgi:septum formation protein